MHPDQIFVVVLMTVDVVESIFVSKVSSLKIPACIQYATC